MTSLVIVMESVIIMGRDAANGHEDLQELAAEVVTEKEHSFLNLEDIILNMREDHFLVNPNQMIGYTSYLEFDKEKNQNLLSFDRERSLEEKKEIVLFNYCVYLVSREQRGKYYYGEIKKELKNRAKRLSRLLVDLSVIKEFGPKKVNEERKVK